MQYLRARYYEPEMMRFSQQDLVRGSVVVPISLNRYLYVQNNPVLYSDPSGMVVKAAIRSTAVSAAGSVKKTVAKKAANVTTSAAKVTSNVAGTVRKTATTSPKASSKTTKTDTNNKKQGAISTLANAVKNVTQSVGIKQDAASTSVFTRTVRGLLSSGSCSGSNKEKTDNSLTEEDLALIDEAYATLGLNYSLLKYPGEIHRAVQAYLCEKYGWLPEMNCSAGRIDLVDPTYELVYEVKPCTYNYSGTNLFSNSYKKFLSAVSKLDEYAASYENGAYSKGVYIPPDSFYYSDYYVSYWYKSDGIILYYFREDNQDPETKEVFEPKESLADYKKPSTNSFASFDYTVFSPSTSVNTTDVINGIGMAACASAAVAFSVGVALTVKKKCYGNDCIF